MFNEYAHIMWIINFIQKSLKSLQWLFMFLYRHIDISLITGLVVLAVVQYYLRPQSQSFQQIQNSGELRVLVSNDPDSLYALNNQFYGFEYALLETFAKSLGVQLKLKVVNYGEIFTLLENGKADLAIGGILDSPFTQSICQPTQPWHQVKMAVVYPRGTRRPKTSQALNNTPVYASSRYYTLASFDDLNLVDDYRSEYTQLAAVAAKKIDYAISVDYRARHAKYYLPNLNRAFLLQPKANLVWALPKQHDPALLAVVNQFLDIAQQYNLPQKLVNHYLPPARTLNTSALLSIHKNIKDKLPNYEQAFKKASKKYNYDWYLLAAIAYQESHWSNEATSPTGVKGIMQLTQSTADFLKVEDRLDVQENIFAAAKYLNYLKSRLPKEINEPERTWFAIGAYNMGLKHILYGYKKAKQQNLNSNQWHIVSQLLPSLYNQPYAGGKQTKQYVERVQIFTDIIRFYDQYRPF